MDKPNLKVAILDLGSARTIRNAWTERSNLDVPVAT
jgi:hypothetical protein